jgi:phosphoesterase RecJ-like protein
VTAQALYVGIATDTGQFRFQSTTGRVFEVCCSLITRGAEPAQAAHALYENEPSPRSSCCSVSWPRCASSAAAAYASACSPGRLGGNPRRPEFSEGLVDYARAIEGVEIGVLLEERNGMVKGSLRSRTRAPRRPPGGTLQRRRPRLRGGLQPGGRHRRALPRLVEALENHFAQLQTT